MLCLLHLLHFSVLPVRPSKLVTGNSPSRSSSDKEQKDYTVQRGSVFRLISSLLRPFSLNYDGFNTKMSHVMNSKDSGLSCKHLGLKPQKPIPGAANGTSCEQNHSIPFLLQRLWKRTHKEKQVLLNACKGKASDKLGASVR